MAIVLPSIIYRTQYRDLLLYLHYTMSIHINVEMEIMAIYGTFGM